MFARIFLLVLAFGLSSTGTAFGSDDQTKQKPTPPRTSASSGNDWPSRAYFALDGGYQVHTLTFSETHHETVFAEDSTWQADYNVKNGVRYEVGAGFRLWRNLLGAVAYSFYRDANSAGITAQIPHPFRFNDPRTISAESTSLDQREQAVHVSGLWMIPATRRLELGVFGGPSIFFLTRSLVEDVAYSEEYPYDTISFSRAATQNVNKPQIGAHGGVDVTWLFTRHYGIGGTIRYATASADLSTPSGGSLSLEMGGLQAGVGLRIRLGDRSAFRGAPRGPRRNPSSPEPLPGPPPATDILKATATTAVTTTTTPVFISPNVTRTPLRELPANTRVRVLVPKGEWTQIEFDDKQWGHRVGYVQSKHLRIEKPGGVE